MRILTKLLALFSTAFILLLCSCSNENKEAVETKRAEIDSTLVQKSTSDSAYEQALYEIKDMNENLDALLRKRNIILQLRPEHGETQATFQQKLQAIATELDDKAKIIQNKFDIYKNIEEKTIIHLINYHKKREFLSEKIKLLSNIKKSRINIIQQYYKAILLKQVLLQTEETLNRLIFNEFSTLFILQEKFIIKLNSLKLNEK